MDKYRTRDDMLEELEEVKEFVTMTEDNIPHDETQQEIIALLNERIEEIKEEIKDWGLPLYVSGPHGGI